MSNEVRSFRMYRSAVDEVDPEEKVTKTNGGFFRWLYTTGADAKASATKFFAMLFSLLILIFFACEGFGVGNIKVPDSADVLLGVFWVAYIGSNKAQLMIEASRKPKYSSKRRSSRDRIPEDSEFPEGE